MTTSSPSTQQQGSLERIRSAFRERGFVRIKDGRVLGGVLSGVGRRLGIEPWPTRLLFLVALLVIPGSQFLIYPVLWVLMPEESATHPVKRV